MKLSNIFKAAPVAAFLFACGGQEKQEPATSAEHAHEHGQEHAVAVNPDTSQIREGQRVFFANLKDGQKVKSPLTVKFGVEGMKVLAVDSGVREGTGHHHLLIDTLGYIKAGEMVPMGFKSILHFGKGQTETTLNLKPGKHTLSLQFANGMHMSYGVRMSRSVTIFVE